MKTAGVSLQIMGWVTFALCMFAGLFLLLLSDQPGLGLAAIVGAVVGGTGLFGIGSALLALTHMQQALEQTADVHEQMKERLEYFAQQAEEANERSMIILEYLAQTVQGNEASAHKSHREKTAPEPSTSLNHAKPASSDHPPF